MLSPTYLCLLFSELPMKKSYQAKYCDESSILLVNPAGQLRRLYCPFRVRCITQESGFKEGVWLWVEQVSVSSKDELLYLVLGAFHTHSHFEVKASF